MPKEYSVKEMAEMLGLRKESVRARIKNRELEPVRYDMNKRATVYSREQWKIIKKKKPTTPKK